jgi:hypothetical protein
MSVIGCHRDTPYLFARTGAAAFRSGGAPPVGWTAEWDRMLLERAAASLDERYDPVQRMVRFR